MDKHELLIEAITKRLVLSIQYDGYLRQVEPHAYGQSSKGDPILRCWQVAGGSQSGQTTGWKLLEVHDMRSVAMTGTTFASPRSGYKLIDPAIAHTYAQL